GEALECIGGNAYVEESDMPRLYREAPVNSLLEGAGNIQALDLVRVLTREPEAVTAWREEVRQAAGADRRIEEALTETDGLLAEVAADPAAGAIHARRLAGRMAVLLQASLLVRFAPPEVADAFCASRLGGSIEGVYGALPSSLNLKAILDRATPQPR